MQIDVVLIKDDPKLGRKGEVLRVKRGFAINYLIPKKIARVATKEDLKRYQEIKEKIKKDYAKKMEILENVKAFVEKRLVKKPVTIKVNTSSAGKIHGSVTPEMVKEALFRRIPQLKVFSDNELEFKLPKKLEYIGKYVFDLVVRSNIGGKKVVETVPIYVDIVSVSKAHLKTKKKE